MRKLTFVLVILAALWLVGELLAIPFANSRIEQQVAARTRDVAAVKASVGSFPVVTRLLLTSKVNSVTVTLDRVTRVGIPFAEIRFDVDGIEMDRTSLFQGNARVRSIAGGTVTATIDLAALPPALRTIAAADVRVQGRTLLLGPRSVVLPQDVMPCDPVTHVEGSQVILSCTVMDVPPILFERINS